MYNIRLGYGCGIKATLLTASGEVCDLRKARYKGALLVLPNGSTIPCADVSVDDVTNAMYVRLLGDRELTTIGKYGILFNVKMANGVMYSSPVVMFGEVQEEAEMEYNELNISIAVTVTYLPSNVAYTGASPKISPNGTWLVYNDEINAYEDTGQPANYAGVLGAIEELREGITERVMVDWRTVGKNADGALCVIGGDTEVAEWLDGYLLANGYVQQVMLDAYATKAWVEGKRYITADDVPQQVSAFANDKGYITLDALATLAKKATTLAGYGITNAYTKEETEAAFFKYTKVDDVTIKRDENGFLYAVMGGGGLTEAQLRAYLEDNGYATQEDIDNAIAKIPDGITLQELVSYLTTNKYATQDYVDDAIANLPSGGGGGITEGDLADYLTTNAYATQSWVESNKGIKPVATLTANKTLTESEYMLVVTASTRITITLPSTVTKGRSYEIFGRNSAGIILKANRTIYRAQGSNSTSHTISAGYFHAMVTYDGTYWLLSITENS